MLIEKEKLLDSVQKPLTQSLFLELGYNEQAVFTLKDNDHEYNGRVYPSLKRLYLEMEDPTEYQFAKTYLLGWRHWKRLCENKAIRKHIDEWREELELQIRSKGVREIIKHAENEKGFQAAKWLADRGWSARGAGRPSKEEIEREKKFQSRMDEDFKADVVRLFGNDS
jgi:hypothetical protein